MFIIWEPPSPAYLKVNFDGSVRDRYVRRSNSRLVVIGGSYLWEPSVFEVELHAAWVGIVYDRTTLGVRQLVLEGDSATVVS